MSCNPIIPASNLPTLAELLTTKSGRRRKILTKDSHKAQVSEDNGKPVMIHYMASHTGGSLLFPELELRVNVCLMATSCAGSCLDKTGRMGTPSVRDSYRHKAVAYTLYPEEYMQLVHQEIQWIAVAIPCRLNGTSDNRYEKVIIPSTGKNILESNPDREFYDYTKWRLKRRMGWIRSGGHLTYSFNEGKNAAKYSREYLEAGFSVAVVIGGPIGCKRPKNTAIKIVKEILKRGSLWGRPVIDGDKYDDRRADPPGSIVLLTAKGPALHNGSGFVIRFDEDLNLVSGHQVL